jgi:hypothetical protein
MRDPQRSRVYAWEEAVVAPRDPSAIPYERAQMLVDGVWLAEQLLYPPRVAPMPRQARRTWATGSRTTIRLPQDRPTPTYVILHEVAHALSSTVDGDSDAHGPDYVGLYMGLLDRRLRIPLPLLMFTAAQHGLAFNLAVEPRFQEP